MSSLNALALKQLGDLALQKSELRMAIDKYSQALHIGTEAPETNSEIKNKSQDLTAETRDEPLDFEERLETLIYRADAYYKGRDIYNALQDYDQALLMLQEMPTDTRLETEKRRALCHLRRAKLRYRFTLYQEAYDDLSLVKRIKEQFEHSQDSRGLPELDKSFEDRLVRGLRLAPQSPEAERLVLFRALQSRGYIIEDQYRSNFPPPPPEDEPELKWCFDRNPGQLASPETPIKVILEMCFPYFKHPYTRTAPFIVRDAVSEGITFAEWIHGYFSQMALPGIILETRWVRRGLTYSASDVASLLVLTRGGRILKVPHETKVGQVAAGAKQQSDGPFRNIRRQSRARPHEIDGVEITEGKWLTVYCMMNDDIPVFSNLKHKEMREAGL